MNKQLYLIICLIIFNVGFCQEKSTVLTLEEYLGYVKKYHPVVKQARLITSEGEIKLLKSRGAFDPKLEVDYNRKKFKDIDYYDKLNAAFKIPTWYGVQLKANYEQNSGTYLNPESKTPYDGLYSAGISLSLAKGLLTNKRMATLRQAKLYTQQAKAKQTLLINEILYDAILSYLNWLKNYQAKLVYADYVVNAETRLSNVTKNYLAGDKPAIDTLEASINLKNRLLDFEKSKIGYIKSSLDLSNYVWLSNNLPLELEESTTPDITTFNKIDSVINSSILNNYGNEALENHPKIKSLEIKKNILTIDKRLKTNNLLPKIDVEYNFLTENYKNTSSLNTANYKGGLNISLPLFLRKERADLKLAKLKLQDINFDISATKVNLKNKINATFQEIDSYKKQYQILLNLVIDYKQLVKSEERKFNLGEGSLFLVNYREAKLIESQLKRIDTEFKLFNSKASLSKVINTLE